LSDSGLGCVIKTVLIDFAGVAVLTGDFLGNTGLVALATGLLFVSLTAFLTEFALGAFFSTTLLMFLQ
jgi:hypothetical protein